MRGHVEEEGGDDGGHVAGEDAGGAVEQHELGDAEDAGVWNG
jgi:hypothetical protein